jgi:ribonuclease HI
MGMPSVGNPQKSTAGSTPGLRRVQDCRLINNLLTDLPFKMEDGNTVRDLARPGMYATSLDFKSAYNLFPMDNRGDKPEESFSFYHCFKVRGVWWRPIGMLFGAKHAPYYFTTALLPVTKEIRRRWEVELVIYLDDVLLLHENPQILRTATAEIADFLLNLGIILATDKCEPIPKEIIQFLGWEWNFREATMKMTKERRKTLTWEVKNWIQKAMHAVRIKVNQLQQLVGKLQFLKPQLSRALLYLKPLSELIGKGLRTEGQEGRVTLNHSIVGPLKWFAKEIAHNSPQSLMTPTPQGYLTTDASETGCGATLLLGEEEFFMCERFSQLEHTPPSSNQRELWAVLKALKHFYPVLKERAIKALTLESDNMTVVYNILKAKAAKGPLKLVRAIHSLLTEMNLRLFPLHLQGVQNSKADALSRLKWMGDYEVRWELVRPHLQKWGVEIQIDLFATNKNRKSTLNCSADKTDQIALWVDAWTRSWKGFNVPLLHPPPAQILACLQRVQSEELTAIIITPMWPSQPWWDKLKKMTTRFQLLGKGEEVLLPGEWMRKRKTKLPPGWIEVALISSTKSKEPLRDNPPAF